MYDHEIQYHDQVKNKLIIQKNQSLMTLPGYGDQPVVDRFPHDQSVTKTPHGKMSERRFHFKQAAVGTINNSFILDYNIFDGMA